jgi:Rhodopirellula transposase DDE domain
VTEDGLVRKPLPFTPIRWHPECGPMQNPMTQAIKAKYASLEPVLDERARRLWAATEARAIGRGGITRVAEATGLSRVTIRAGLNELNLPVTPAKRRAVVERIRRPGGGRKALAAHDPDLLHDLETLVDPVTRGDPMSPLRWTCKSAEKIATELQARGHGASERSVNRLLHDLGYSLQSNRKTIEGKGHPDRDAQFQYINRRVKAFQRQGQPVISVDAKKKELVGQFRNAGREWQPEGQPEEVEVYDFAKKDLGKAIPYGIYDQTNNTGWVSVGIDHDTAEFAVETLRRWWRNMGSQVYPQAKRLLITADGGGSNGSRCRLWKVELQRLADEIGLRISVCHFPPGTSKWNKIEHRMFCHITENWRGRPLVSREVVVNLIGHTTTTGLSIRSELDEGSYPTGREVSEEQIKGLSIRRDKFHGEWNYTIFSKK